MTSTTAPGAGPQGIATLDEIIEAMREGVLAIDNQTTRVGYLLSMIDLLDGTAQTQTEETIDFARITARLTSAISAAQALKASAQFAAAMDADCEDAHSTHLVSVEAEALALTAPFPDAARLLAARDDLLQELDASIPEEGEDQEVTLDGANAESLIRLMEGAARSATTPIEVAVVVRRGMVETIRFDATDQRPVTVHVLDHDVENIADAPTVAKLSDEDGFPTPAFLARYERNHDDASDAAHAWWRTLRAEAARIDKHNA